MRRWDGLQDGYLEEYRARGVCPATITQVQRELDRWGLWLKHRRPKPNLEAVDSDQIIDYLKGRTQFRAKATVSGTMSILRGMGEYLLRQGIWQSNPLRWMHGPKLDWRMHLPRRIGSDSMKQLWESVAAGRQGYHRWMWIAALALLYGTGMRRGELERLDLADWNREEGMLLVDGRKTGQERRVPLPELAWRCLESYLPHRQNHLVKLGIQQDALFVNKDGGRLKGTSISCAIHSIARRGKLPRITLHQFRHSCASDLLEGGVCLPEVQRILGHETITTTVRYLHIADPQRHEAVKRHPINDILKVETIHEER
jgi:integrase/recombinase XerC